MIISLSYPAEVTVSQQRLIVEYFVPGARWTPTYLCRLESSTNTAAIAVRAFLCQRTGEDWSGVRLELSTANPMTWCELPELPSLRLGRTQPVPRKSGWRLPPVGATMLFADYDRQKPQVETVSEQFQNLESSSIDVPPLPQPKLRFDRYQANQFYGRGKLRSRSRRDGVESFILTYNLMRLPGADDPNKRGKLLLQNQQDVYLELFKQQQFVVTFNHRFCCPVLD